MKLHAGHWSIFHGNQIEQQLRLKAIADTAAGQTNEKGASHAKGQMIGVGTVLSVSILLVVLLKLV